MTSSIENQVFDLIKENDGQLDSVDVCGYLMISPIVILKTLQVLEGKNKIIRAPRGLQFVYEIKKV